MNTQGSFKATRIETLHDNEIEFSKVKKTKEYDCSEYEGNITSRILHAKILGDPSYQTMITQTKEIQKDFQIKSDMNKDVVSNFQNK